MSEAVKKKLEAAAYVAVIVLAVVTSAVLVKRFLIGGDGAVRPEGGIVAGTRLTLPGVDWAEADRTLLLALSTQCRYCTESAPFYRRLAAEAAKRRNVRLVGVLPQRADESGAYLSRHGVALGRTVQASPDVLGVRGTPTLILVDGSGAVVKSWVGRLPEGEEADVLAHLGG
jgi:hypothetical protein